MMRYLIVIAGAVTATLLLMVTLPQLRSVYHRQIEDRWIVRQVDSELLDEMQPDEGDDQADVAKASQQDADAPPVAPVAIKGVSMPHPYEPAIADAHLPIEPPSIDRVWDSFELSADLTRFAEQPPADN